MTVASLGERPTYPTYTIHQYITLITKYRDL
jgi:hypothetical protein